MEGPSRRFVTADVFTDRLHGGNPVAVVLDAAGLASDALQAIACEFNLSETAFVLPPSNPAHTAHVRIFTPRTEVPFAGHPNVGTAFVLARDLARQGVPLPERFVFEEAAGLVPVELLRDGAQVVGAELTAPEQLSRRAELEPELVAELLSLDVQDLRMDTHRPEIASVGLPFVVVELVSRSIPSRARPNLAAYERHLPYLGADAVYAYTADTRNSAPGVDIEARMYSPLDGIVEDPATGSATAAMVALRRAALGFDELTLRVSQGVDMARPSLLNARAVQRGSRHEVAVGGQCVVAMEGRLATS